MLTTALQLGSGERASVATVSERPRGYALALPAVIERGKPDGLVRSIDALRANITERIMKALPGPEGGVVAALLAG